MIVMAQKEKLEALYSAIKYFVMEALYIIFIPYSFTRIHCVHCVQAQSCQTLCDLINCNLPGPSVHGIFQVRILASIACLPPGHIPHPGTEPASPASPSLKVGSLSAEPLERLHHS